MGVHIEFVGADSATDFFVSIFQHPSNPENLLKVNNQIVFVHHPEEESFRATLKMKNLSCRYVTYMVRSSERKKFKIKPRYGFLRPREAFEICVKTRNVKQFHEISQDFFGVFALTIYDKRQLETRKLSVLWSAHGTELFPYSATEFHGIPYIVPKTDKYLDHLSISARIQHGSYIALRWSCEPSMMDKEELSLNEDNFLLLWPGGYPTKENSQLDPVIEEWHEMAKKIKKQTKQILKDFSKTFENVMRLTTFAFMMFLLYILILFAEVPVSENDEKILPVSTPESSSWLSWFGF